MSGAHQMPQTIATTTNRIRNCSNNTNIDTIQCESYAPKLRQRPPMSSVIGPLPKSVHTKPNRERSASRSRCVPSVVSNVSPCVRSPTLVGNRIRRENSVNSVVRKEVYTSVENPALVEVTVKTHANGHQVRPTKQQTVLRTANVTGNHGESWSKILQRNNALSSIASEGSSFSNFDPLRTVHFLAKELQSKLQDNLSDDDHSIRQIISDMQQALHRVPPEVASTLGLSISPQYILSKVPPTPTTINGGFNYDYPTKDDMRQERLLGVIKSSTTAYNTVERGCQTAKCRNMVLEPEKFQQHLEDSTAKIESACRQMEVVCSRLKTDKEELERELLSEREVIQTMRTQQEQTVNGQSATNERLAQLETERNVLQRDLQQLKMQLSGSASQSRVLQELQVQKLAADDQLAAYRQQLTIAKMETEKYVAILAARDKQVTEIRSEMNQLQELVVEQLREIQAAPCTSSATSCATNATSGQSLPCWLPVNKINIVGDRKFADTDRDIYKEIADAMANMADGGGGGSTTCDNGGDTTPSIGGSGTSSTTTIAGSTAIVGAKKSNGRREVLAPNKTTVLDEANGETKVGRDDDESTVNIATAGASNFANITSNNSNPQSVTVEPRTVSIRDMFADIKKQALLINAHHLTVKHQSHHRAT